jgi:uncharacterized protein YciI
VIAAFVTGDPPMRRLSVLAAAAALSLSAALPAFAAEPSSPAAAGAQGPYGSAFTGEKKVWIMLIRLRGDLYRRWRETGQWPSDSAADVALDGHVAYWRKLLADGTALMAGGMDGDYWDNAAVIVLEAPSQAQAEAIARADPAVKAYVFDAQVRPFGLHWITNKFDKAVAR